MTMTTPWNILQLDVCTSCTLHCPTCPRTAFAQNWRNQHVSQAVVDRLLPYADRFRLVHLQGWGEPLLHPDLPGIIESFTKAGVSCGLTTNGVQLSHDLGRRLLQSGLQQLTLSLSGTSAETQALLRPPSKLDEILDNIGQFKAQAGSSCVVRLSFLRQPENQHEMVQAVNIAQKLHLDGILGVNPTYLSTPEHVRRLVRPGRKAYWASIKARLTAFFNKQDLTIVGVEPDCLPSCLNRPQENLTVAVDGGVSPCVFLQLPLKAVPLGFAQPLLSFGNVLENDLEAIWNEPAYQKFRAPFVQREEIYDRLAQQAVANLGESDALQKFRDAIARMDTNLPLPSVCAGCLKAQGL